jgi:hypothetical protein
MGPGPPEPDVRTDGATEGHAGGPTPFGLRVSLGPVGRAAQWPAVRSASRAVNTASRETFRASPSG